MPHSMWLKKGAPRSAFTRRNRSDGALCGGSRNPLGIIANDSVENTGREHFSAPSSGETELQGLFASPVIFCVSEELTVRPGQNQMHQIWYHIVHCPS